MNRLARFRSFMRALVFRRRVEREMDGEWAFHLESRIDDLVAGGLTQADAERRARIEFGDTLRWKEEGREARGFRLLDELRQDTAYAFRQMRRMPGFTLVAVLTLALGIGATTAIFSVVNAVLLRPLPFNHSESFVRIFEGLPVGDSASAVQQPRRGLNPIELALLRERSRQLSDIGMYIPTTATLTGRERAVRLEGIRLSPVVLEMLEAKPMIGRLFEEREEKPGLDAAVLLSHGVWQREFGGDAAVVGQQVSLEGRAYTIVGVMAAGFQFPDRSAQFWTPFVMPTGPMAAFQRMVPIARLAEGASPTTAALELSVLLRRPASASAPPQQQPAPNLPPPPPPPPPPGKSAQAGAPGPLPAMESADPNAPRRFEVIRMHEQLVGSVRPPLFVLLAGVGLLLLIACVNVANLLLARMTAREQELSVRRALGASSGRLVRQLLAESLLLGMTGGVAGVALALGGVRILQTFGVGLVRRDLGPGAGLPRLGDVTIDGTALAFTLAASLLTGALFGLAPAVRQTRDARFHALHDGLGPPASELRLGHRYRAQGVLVIAEIVMATVLCVAGGLLMRSFANVASIAPGYDPTNVLTFQLSLPGGRSAAASTTTFAEEVVAQLRRVPGVRAAGYTEQLPMVQRRGTIPLRTTPELPRQAPPPPPAPGATNPPEFPDVRFVSHEFLDVMGIRIVAGRGFAETDRLGQPQVMLINRTLARSGLVGDNPIGKQIYAIGTVPWEIVGIVDDVQLYGLDEQPGAQVFFDLRQMPISTNGTSPGAVEYFAVRTEGDPTSLLPSIRSLVHQLSPYASLDHIATMKQVVSNSILRRRLYAVLLSIFGIVAITLAVVGIYGVMAYAVARRTREIGVRMALGAERASVLRLVLAQSGLLIAIGLTLGLAGAAGATRYLKGMLFGLTALDPLTYIAVAVLFAVVAMIAALIPARRAANVDPLVALRCE